MCKKDYICVQSLQSGHNCWGEVGIDIETGERLYFVNKDKRKPNRPVNYATWRKIKIGDYNDRYSRRYYETTEFPTRGAHTLDPEVQDYIELSIDNHIAYNQSNNLPTYFLENNRKKYSAFCHYGNPEIFTNPMASAFAPHSISMLFPFNSFKGFDDEAKKEIKQVIDHEVGHMKVSSLSIPQRGVLQFKSGFNETTLRMRREPIIGGGGLLFLNEEYPSKPVETYLGEIANELELKEMDPEYRFSYNDFGKRINDLTNGALLISRYEGGIEYFIEALLETIGDETEAKKLLEALIIAIPSPRKEHIEEADMLISRHERK